MQQLSTATHAINEISHNIQQTAISTNDVSKNISEIAHAAEQSGAAASNLARHRQANRRANPRCCAARSRSSLQR
jgi:methyl-accepting chemotaxis protein